MIMLWNLLRTRLAGYEKYYGCNIYISKEISFLNRNLFHFYFHMHRNCLTMPYKIVYKHLFKTTVCWDKLKFSYIETTPNLNAEHIIS